MNAPATFPRSRTGRLASSPEIKRLLKAARDAGLDPAGFDALPDGTVRIFTADTMAAKGTLFDELERRGEI